MITNKHFMLATACLFTVAVLGGCATNSNLSENEKSEAPTETASETTIIDAAPPKMAEETAAITVDKNSAIPEISTTVDTTEIAETAQTVESDAPKVTTTENGVVIIPLGTTPEEVAAATVKAIPAPDISHIAKELANHRNTQWHSRSFTYRLYLGGQLNAEYSQEKDALTISADSEDQLNCKYSTKHGGLASIDDNTVSACNTLANELQSYLEQD